MSQCYIVMLTNVCLTHTIVVIVYIVVMIYIVVYSSQPTTVQIHLVVIVYIVYAQQLTVKQRLPYNVSVALLQLHATTQWFIKARQRIPKHFHSRKCLAAELLIAGKAQWLQVRNNGYCFSKTVVIEGLEIKWKGLNSDNS